MRQIRFRLDGQQINDTDTSTQLEMEDEEKINMAYWSGLPFPSPGDLFNLGIKPKSPALQAQQSSPWVLFWRENSAMPASRTLFTLLGMRREKHRERQGPQT